MKTTFAAILLAAGLSVSASAQVYINELMVNAPGGDGGRELFELRGTPNLSLANYYLISIEGEGSTGLGDINQYLDLSTYSLGANGFLVGRQFGSTYGAIEPGATLLQPSTGPGWTNFGVYYSDGNNSGDMENSATTVLLVNIGSGAAPTLATDLDTEGDGVLDLPAGWNVIDSVGLIDSVGAADTNRTYGAINFRLGTLGTNVVGNFVQVPGTGTTLYVGRIGNSTGSTSDDWFGGVLSGSTPPEFFFGPNVSDSRFAGKLLSEMGFGGPNPVPEPSALGLLAVGLSAKYWLISPSPVDPSPSILIR